MPGSNPCSTLRNRSGVRCSVSGGHIAERFKSHAIGGLDPSQKSVAGQRREVRISSSVGVVNGSGGGLRRTPAQKGQKAVPSVATPRIVLVSGPPGFDYLLIRISHVLRVDNSLMFTCRTRPRSVLSRPRTGRLGISIFPRARGWVQVGVLDSRRGDLAGARRKPQRGQAAPAQ